MNVALFGLFIFLSAFKIAKAGTVRGTANETPPGFNDTLVARELDQSRRLMVRDLVPLICNRQLESATCTMWSERIGTDSVFSRRVTIDCGECVIMDHAGDTLTFHRGLDVRGKLIFPDGYKLNIISTMIAVQGHLEMTATKPVDGIPSIKFTMIGSNELQTLFTMGENRGVCDGEPECVVGKKSITVAGGRVTSKF